MLTIIDKQNKEELMSYLESRNTEISNDVLLAASNIIADVRVRGDEACKEYTFKFDGIKMDDFRVSEKEIEDAIGQCDPDFCKAMDEAKKNIEFYHRAQKQNGYILTKEMGIFLGQRVLPLASVGIYVPGGRAQYPSSVLMNTIPAKVAGVKRIVMVTPPSKEGTINPNIA